MGNHRHADGRQLVKTILRVVTPNAMSSLIEVFSYYFINSMVTISALIFIAGARTMVLTTMIKQLQYVNRFNRGVCIVSVNPGHQSGSQSTFFLDGQS